MAGVTGFGGFRFDGDYFELHWLRWIPHVGFTIHLGVMYLAANEIAWDLDDPRPDDLFIQLLQRGIDDPSEEDEDDGPSYEELGLTEADRLHDEQAARERAVALAQAAHAVGLEPATTVRETFELMRRLGLISREVRDGQVYWEPVAPLPLPEDVIPMTDEQRAAEDRGRWRSMHSPSSQAILRLFVDEQLTHVEGTLRELGARLDLVPDDVRAGIEVLLSEGDFTLSRPVDEVGPDDPVVLTVDWDEFNRTRIGFKLNLPPDVS